VTDTVFLKAALAQAYLADLADEVPVGAVVVKDGVVIAEGFNTKYETGTVLGHAEINAIQNAADVLGDWRLNGCTLYSTLEPCPMCLGVILHSRLDRVVYGALDRKWGACGSILDFATPVLFNHQVKNDFVPMDDCSEILTAFFKRRRLSQ
jgi:tRNA(adenine34) deaminase